MAYFNRLYLMKHFKQTWKSILMEEILHQLRKFWKKFLERIANLNEHDLLLVIAVIISSRSKSIGFILPL